MIRVVATVMFSGVLSALSMQLIAQGADSVRRTPLPSVSGVVHDSVAAAVLARAAVQIVSADAFARFGRTTTADSLGRYAFGDIPPGRYMLGFFHPVLDSIGIEAPLREVRVEGSEPVRADLAIPSAARIRAVICGGDAKTVGGALIGVVREAHDSTPAAGVTVTGEWIELSIGAGGLMNRLQRLVATTGENGRFIMCNVPNAGTMTLIASRGGDSTDRIDIQVPAHALMRHELFIAPTVASGTSHLSGVVVAAAGGQPLAGAQVTLGTGAPVRTNERGEWTLGNLAVGTRMLEVRAIGYYPDRRAVDVVAGRLYPSQWAS